MSPARHRDLDTISFHVVMWTLAIVTVVVLVAPTIVVLMVSFTSGFSLKFPPPGYSLRWYVSLFDAWQLHFAATNSFIVAIASTAMSIVLGVAASLAIAKSDNLTARLLDSLFMSPLVLPALAFGLSALMYFSLLGISLSMTTLIIGHIVVCVPYVIRTTVASLAQLDPALLESSASLGAGRFYTFRRVTWPAIRGGVFAGAFIAFMSSFDNVPVSLFLADARSDMLPIRMWQNLEGNLDVRTASVSGVLIAATIILLVIMEKVSGISQKLR